MLTIHDEYWEGKADGISSMAFGLDDDVRTWHNGCGSNSGSTGRCRSPSRWTGCAGFPAYGNGHIGFCRWYRNSGEIYSGRQPNLTSNNVDQRPRGYDELPFAHA